MAELDHAHEQAENWKRGALSRDYSTILSFSQLDYCSISDTDFTTHFSEVVVQIPLVSSVISCVLHVFALVISFVILFFTAHPDFVLGQEEL